MNHDARAAIEAITQAMSSLSCSSLRDDASTRAAYEHLTIARRLLIAKYEPNAEEIGR